MRGTTKAGIWITSITAYLAGIAVTLGLWLDWEKTSDIVKVDGAIAAALFWPIGLVIYAIAHNPVTLILTAGGVGVGLMALGPLGGIVANIRERKRLKEDEADRLLREENVL